MWEEINEFYLSVQDPAARSRARFATTDFFRSVRRTSHLLLGVTDSTLSHGESWHFNRMGRLLERADKSTRVLDVKYFLLLPEVSDVGTPTDDLHWSAVLRSVSGFEMYRKIHGQVSAPKIAEFLLLDRDFPAFGAPLSDQSLLFAAFHHRYAAGPVPQPRRAPSRAGGHRVGLHYDGRGIQSGIARVPRWLAGKVELGGGQHFRDLLCSQTLEVAIRACFSDGKVVAMTFCLGISLEEGLVGIADTRVTSGTECITARKVSVYHQERGRDVRDDVGSALAARQDPDLFRGCPGQQPEPFDRVFKAVNLFTQQLRQVAAEDKKPLLDGGLDFNIHALIGGQMENDGQHRLYLVYPEGNWVATGVASPYHIIGSTRYGKPVLDRALTHADTMQHAFKVGCLAFDSTRISAADVGFPIDVVLYRRESFHIIEHRYGEKDLRQISNWWQERIRTAVQELPNDWLEELFSKVYPLEEKQAPAAD